VIGVVTGNGFAGGTHAAWVGIVDQSGGVAERGENCFCIEVQAADGGVGGGEVDEFPVRGAGFAQRESVRVLGGLPLGSR